MSFTFHGIVLSDLNDFSQQAHQAFKGRNAFAEIHLSANNLLGMHHNQKQGDGERQSAGDIKKKRERESKLWVVPKPNSLVKVWVSVSILKPFFQGLELAW